MAKPVKFQAVCLGLCEHTRRKDGLGSGHREKARKSVSALETEMQAVRCAHDHRRLKKMQNPELYPCVGLARTARGSFWLMANDECNRRSGPGLRAPAVDEVGQRSNE